MVRGISEISLCLPSARITGPYHCVCFKKKKKQSLCPHPLQNIYTWLLYVENSNPGQLRLPWNMQLPWNGSFWEWTCSFYVSCRVSQPSYTTSSETVGGTCSFHLWKLHSVTAMTSYQPRVLSLNGLGLFLAVWAFEPSLGFMSLDRISCMLCAVCPVRCWQMGGEEGRALRKLGSTSVGN